MKSDNGIIGFAIGDALGVPVEYKTREELKLNPVKDMLEYGTHNQPKGSWSDDTSLTLATISSIIKQKEIDTEDIAKEFIKWFRNSDYTATGKIFDIGRTTIQALVKYELKMDIAKNCGEDNEFSNGNGSLMRMLPVAYYCLEKKLNDEEIIKLVSDVSSITHKHQVSILGCYIYVRFIMQLLNSKNKSETYRYIQKLDYSFFSNNVVSKYYRILRENIQEKKEEDISSSGYVVDTLECVLWLFMNSNDYNTTILKAVNLGNDTDTIGACVGALLGIYYGKENIKSEWKSKLLKINYIIDLCNKFDEVLNKQ